MSDQSLVCATIKHTMVVQGGRSTARFYQLHARRLTLPHTLTCSKRFERVPTLYALLSPICEGLNALGKISNSPQNHRTYTTRPVSRPKQHTGRTTSTRKAPTTKAAKVPRPRKTTAKAAPKAKSKPKPKPREKAKPKAKAKAKPKPKPKPKPKRKVLSEIQKQQKAAKAQRDKVAALKNLALKIPIGAPSSAWSVLLVESVKGQRSGSASVVNGTKEASQKYKSLSPEELEASPSRGWQLHNALTRFSTTIILRIKTRRKTRVHTASLLHRTRHYRSMMRTTLGIT